jgi:hypothetical protein
LACHIEHAPTSYDHAFGQLYRSLSFNFTPEVIEDSNTFDELRKSSATIVAESGEAFPDLVWSLQADRLKDLLPNSACTLPLLCLQGQFLGLPGGALVSLLEAGFLLGSRIDRRLSIELIINSISLMLLLSSI